MDSQEVEGMRIRTIKPDFFKHDTMQHAPGMCDAKIEVPRA